MLTLIPRFLIVCVALFSFEGRGSDTFSDETIKKEAKKYASITEFLQAWANDAVEKANLKKAKAVLHIIATGSPFGFRSSAIPTTPKEEKAITAALRVATHLLTPDTAQIYVKGLTARDHPPAVQAHQTRVLQIIEKMKARPPRHLQALSPTCPPELQEWGRTCGGWEKLADAKVKRWEKRRKKWEREHPGGEPFPQRRHRTR